MEKIPKNAERSEARNFSNYFRYNASYNASIDNSVGLKCRAVYNNNRANKDIKLL